MHRSISVICLVVVAVASPTGALAVNVSSSDGSGTQVASSFFGNGANFDWHLEIHIRQHRLQRGTWRRGSAVGYRCGRCGHSGNGLCAAGTACPASEEEPR